MSSVKIVKLVNGEEILGKVTAKNGEVVITKPTILGMMQGQNGQPQMGLADYLPLAEDTEITIDKTHVLLTYTPKTQLVNAYNASHGSGLVVPPSTKIIGT